MKRFLVTVFGMLLLAGATIVGSPLAAERTISVIQAWGKPESAAIALLERSQDGRHGFPPGLTTESRDWYPRS